VGPALLLALTAGMLGAVNPCGFAVLPAYLSVLVAADRTDTAPGAVGRALRCAAALTLGYVAVFGAFGLLLAPLAGRLGPRLPWLTMGFGVLLAALGAWLLAGRGLPALARAVRAPRLTGSVGSTALFGMAYAVSSLGCAVGPFLAIVVSAVRAGSPVRAVALFLAFAAGMGVAVAVAAVAAALLRHSVLARLRRAGAAVPRLGGAVLLVAGAYLAYYGWYEHRLATDPRGALGDPVVAAASDLQRWLSALLGAVGAGPLAVVLAALLVVVWGAGRRRPRAGTGGL
jgi:cytochrome c-type biogenesis protein